MLDNITVTVTAHKAEAVISVKLPPCNLTRVNSSSALYKDGWPAAQMVEVVNSPVLVKPGIKAYVAAAVKDHHQQLRAGTRCYHFCGACEPF